MIFPEGGVTVPHSFRSKDGVVWSPFPHFGVATCTPCSFTAPSDGILVDILLPGKGKM